MNRNHTNVPGFSAESVFNKDIQISYNSEYYNLGLQNQWKITTAQMDLCLCGGCECDSRGNKCKCPKCAC